MNTDGLAMFLRRAAGRVNQHRPEQQRMINRMAKKQAEALSPMLDEMDRNARAYGWEIGQGREIATDVEFSDDNPFKDPNWRDNIEGRQTDREAF